jgi:ribosomal protein S27AE
MMRTRPETEALNSIRHALKDEIGETPFIGDTAEALHAIALQFDVRIADLLVWIHYRLPGKEWSAGEFRRWCEKFTEARRELEQFQEEEDTQKLCPLCESHFAARTHDGRWWCPDCGVVP